MVDERARPFDWFVIDPSTVITFGLWHGVDGYRLPLERLVPALVSFRREQAGQVAGGAHQRAVDIGAAHVHLLIRVRLRQEGVVALAQVVTQMVVPFLPVLFCCLFLEYKNQSGGRHKLRYVADF